VFVKVGKDSLESAVDTPLVFAVDNTLVADGVFVSVVECITHHSPNLLPQLILKIGVASCKMSKLVTIHKIY
jgi:hypothetical protein